MRVSARLTPAGGPSPLAREVGLAKEGGTSSSSAPRVGAKELVGRQAPVRGEGLEP
jgi:hypothetical protein